jgi:hypothetical protein
MEDTLEAVISSNLLLKERTRAKNKFNPYSSKVSAEIRPESLAFLTKNSG